MDDKWTVLIYCFPIIKILKVLKLKPKLKLELKDLDGLFLRKENHINSFIVTGKKKCFFFSNMKHSTFKERTK